MMNLINADCMDIMREFKDGQFDLAIVDPPYYADVEKMTVPGNLVSTTGNERNRYDIDFSEWDVPSIDYYRELCRVSKHQIIFGINYFEFSAETTGGMIVWDKKNDHSSFGHAEVASCSLIRSIKMFRYTWDGMRQEHMDWRKEERIHPNQKPIKLYEWLMMKFSESGQSILDTHMGSGSSAIAAVNLGISYTGIEKSREMFEKAKQRIEQMTQQERLFA